MEDFKYLGAIDDRYKAASRAYGRLVSIQVNTKVRMYKSMVEAVRCVWSREKSWFRLIREFVNCCWHPKLPDRGSVDWA